MEKITAPQNNTLLSIGLAAILALTGCQGDSGSSQTTIASQSKQAATHKEKGVDLQPPEYYANKLTDPDFVWNGMQANCYRIPANHAARALALIGDPAVPYLLDAIKNEDVDIISVFDALAEIGLPVGNYREEILNRDNSGISLWWEMNRAKTLEQRNDIRKKIGLPIIEHNVG